MLHADPHPGNFRIMPDGRLGVVDYGAVARLPEGLPSRWAGCSGYAVDGDYDRVLDGLRDEGFLKRTTDLDADTIARYIGPFVEPRASSGSRSAASGCGRRCSGSARRRPRAWAPR